MSERETIRSMVADAETIAVPSGRDYAKCVDALREECDIDVPDFPDRVLTVETNGQTWRMVKGKDVPLRVARGLAQVGLTGTDILLNQPRLVTSECLRFDEASQLEERRLVGGEAVCNSPVRSRYYPLGQKMCEFSLLGAESAIDELRQVLYDADAPPFGKRPMALSVATSFPVLLGRFRDGRNFQILDEPISGSVEGAVGWLAPVAADLVEKGTTMKANGLAEIERLTDIYPAVFRCEPTAYRLDRL